MPRKILLSLAAGLVSPVLAAEPPPVPAERFHEVPARLEPLPPPNRPVLKVDVRERLAELERGRAPVAAQNDLRRKYEEQLKQFEESIKNAADAEAKQELEKARDEYKKTMEGPLKKADAENPLRPQPLPLPLPPRPNQFGGVFPNPFPNPGAGDDEVRKQLEQLQRDLQKQLMEEMKRANPNGPALPLPFPALEPKEIDDLFKDLLDPNARPGANPFGPLGGMPARRPQTQPRLGVQVEKVPAVLVDQLDLPRDSGLVVTEVVPGSAAEKGGLKKNDVLLKLADADVPTDPAAFTAQVSRLKGGEKIDAVVVRKGKRETVKGIELADDQRPGRPGGARNEQVQIQINGDDVATLTATVNGVGYSIVGPLKNGKLDPAKIVVTEGRESKEYESLEKVPEAQRATAERLMGRAKLFGR